MYSLEQLRIFSEVAATGSFSACARKLSKAQSAISQSIAALEIDLDTLLFDRSARTPVLTPAGEKLLGYAQAVLKQSQELNKAATALSKAEESHLIIAIDDALMLPKLKSILVDLSHHFVASEVEIHSIASPDMMDHLSQGKADIGLQFANIGLESAFDVCNLGYLPFYAVAHPNHPLATLSQIDIRDIMSHKQLLIRGVNGRHLTHFLPISVQKMYCNNFDTLRQLTRLGLAWSYLPCHMVEEDIAGGKLMKLPFNFDYKPWQAPVEWVRPSQQTVGPALSWFEQELRNLFN
ncbi:LysR family transcriptional regulator [Marinomonas sp. TI.3.20]|uniref:LysR family transcriptional regulator n=1 Tax=Marinomonas sp. TI.3.20 TaxID=3121296 RepID=UPI00311FA9AD